MLMSKVNKLFVNFVKSIIHALTLTLIAVHKTQI